MSIWSDRRRRAHAGLVVASTVVGFAFWAPAFLAPEATGWGDWQWFHHMWEAGRVAVLRHGEWPLFNPHHCGGVPLWGNPQSQVLSPTWAITGLLFGTTLGHKLFLALHTGIAFAGTFALGRRVLGLRAAGATLAAFVWSCSGFFALHGAGGHATFCAFAYGPALLLAWRLAEDDLRHAASVALLLGLVLAEGGHYPFPYFVLLLGFDALARVWPFASWERSRRVLRAGLLAAALTALIGAFRVVPIFLTVTRFPKPVRSDDALTLAEVLELLVARDHPWFTGEHVWVWGEYGAFVGWLPVALAGWGVLHALRVALPGRAGDRRTRGRLWAVTGLVLFVAFTQGKASPFHPWSLVHEHLPFYGSLHVPSRFRVLLTLFLALLAGVGLDGLTRALRRATARARPRLARVLRGLPWVVVLAAAVDLFLVNVSFNDRWNGPPLAAPVEPAFRLVPATGYYERYARYPMRNVGTRFCYDPVPWKVSRALWVGPLPQARVEPRDVGAVTEASRTSMTLRATVRLDAAGMLVFNQTHHPELRSDVGETVDHRGLLAVRLPPGTHRVTVRFAPPDLPWAPLATALGMCCAGLVIRRPRYQTPDRPPGS